MSDFDNISEGPDDKHEYPPRSSTEFEIPLPSSERIAQILREVTPSIASITGKEEDDEDEIEVEPESD